MYIDYEKAPIIACVTVYYHQARRQGGFQVVSKNVHMLVIAHCKCKIEAVSII